VTFLYRPHSLQVSTGKLKNLTAGADLEARNAGAAGRVDATQVQYLYAALLQSRYGLPEQQVMGIELPA
jgi:hypothetical protein